MARRQSGCKAEFSDHAEICGHRKFFWHDKCVNKLFCTLIQIHSGAQTYLCTDNGQKQTPQLCDSFQDNYPSFLVLPHRQSAAKVFLWFLHSISNISYVFLWQHNAAKEHVVLFVFFFAPGEPLMREQTHLLMKCVHPLWANECNLSSKQSCLLINSTAMSIKIILVTVWCRKWWPALATHNVTTPFA